MTKMRTKQQIFDIASVHLLKQKKVCQGDDGCLYHGEDGLRCAVGAFISKKNYRVAMEEKNIRQLFVKFKRQMSACGLSKRHLELLDSLQSVHDDTGVEYWRVDLTGIARDFNVSTVKMDAVK